MRTVGHAVAGAESGSVVEGEGGALNDARAKNRAARLGGHCSGSGGATHFEGTVVDEGCAGVVIGTDQGKRTRGGFREVCCDAAAAVVDIADKINMGYTSDRKIPKQSGIVVTDQMNT